MGLFVVWWRTACNTNVSVAFSFGGQSWSINPDDMNLGTVSKSQCLGGIFDISQGTNIGSDSSVPSWIVGDTFLVRTVCLVY